MPLFEVLAPIKSGGKFWPIGSQVELDLAVAEPLLQLARIVPVHDAGDDDDVNDTETKRPGRIDKAAITKAKGAKK